MSVMDRAKTAVKSVLPAPTVAALRRRFRGRFVAAPQPISRFFGLDRGGRAIDRHYIERFLSRHASDIHGRVLEVGDPGYTHKFGGTRVERSDVLHVDSGHKGATIIGNLATGRGIPGDTFDCMICTQTLLFIYDVHSAVANIRRLLRPGGVALVTMPCIAHIARFGMDRWGDFWRFTSLSARRLFGDVFGDENVEVHSYGNSLAAVCMLQGLTVEELTEAELDRPDRDYEMIVAIRAVKRGGERS